MLINKETEKETRQLASNSAKKFVSVIDLAKANVPTQKKRIYYLNFLD